MERTEGFMGVTGSGERGGSGAVARGGGRVRVWISWACVIGCVVVGVVWGVDGIFKFGPLVEWREGEVEHRISLRRGLWYSMSHRAEGAGPAMFRDVPPGGDLLWDSGWQYYNDKMVGWSRFWFLPYGYMVGALLTTLGVVQGVALVGKYRARRRFGEGLCPSCGYDLRASPERCPECGRARG